MCLVNVGYQGKSCAVIFTRRKCGSARGFLVECVEFLSISFIEKNRQNNHADAHTRRTSCYSADLQSSGVIVLDGFLHLLTSFLEPSKVVLDEEGGVELANGDVIATCVHDNRFLSSNWMSPMSRMYRCVTWPCSTSALLWQTPHTSSFRWFIFCLAWVGSGRVRSGFHFLRRVGWIMLSRLSCNYLWCCRMGWVR